ncbi:glycosyltransferase family 2 protein [Candidatus Saccharibacteria bacterium]|nr:glycosyltransferase family 2 protein [Candidatus Saccharibacteria bacterium]
MDKPLVSIIVPVYNIEKYILRCLKSLARQKYENIEILVIDDGSSDESGKICDEFASGNERVKVFHKKNGGLSDARNYGIRKAKGELIALVDGDDYVSEDYILVLVENLVEKDVDIVVCGYNDVVSKAGVMTGAEATANLLVGQENIDIVAWNKLYVKRLFVEENIWYPVGEKNEDSLTTYKLYAAAKKVVYVDRALYNYIERDGSIMNNTETHERLKMREKAAEEAVQYFEGDVDLKKAAEVALLTAKYAFVDAGLRGEVPKSVMRENMSWIKKNIDLYCENQFVTRKIRIYNTLVKKCFWGYKLFRRIRHE